MGGKTLDQLVPYFSKLDSEKSGIDDDAKRY